MAWTASKDREDASHIYIVFTEAGNPSSPQTLPIAKPVTLERAQEMVRDWIAAHSATGIDTGAITPAAAPTPDVDQTLMEQWQEAVFNFRQAEKGVALGLFNTSSQFYATPQTAMLNMWAAATTPQKVKALKVI